ncbi:MAG: DUF3995 domain-containing protein [Sediminibacterium sp.]|nr:DUF3995 domain-containing protein [Sediminibacterium sp.]
MTVFFPLVLVFIFAGIALIHVYWGVGGKWGADAVIPATVDGKKLMAPRSFECFAVAFAFLALIGFVFLKAQWISLFALPHWLNANGLVLISFVFFLRAIGEFKYVGFFKKVKSTLFARMDTRFYSPLCAFIALVCLLWNYWE